jgi:hypothetical protein
VRIWIRAAIGRLAREILASASAVRGKETIMLRITNMIGTYRSKLDNLMKSAPLMRVALLLAVGGGLLAVRSGMGDENDGNSKSAQSARAAAQRTAASDQPGRSDRGVAEDHVRHHGALGVLLSPSNDGVLVVGVISGSAAARAGLRSGDEIRFVGDSRIHTISELTDTVGNNQPGTLVDLIIIRNGRRQVAEATLGAQDPAGGERTGEDVVRGAGGVSPRATAPTGGRTPDAPAAASGAERERQMSLRMRAMERQVYRLQQDLNEVRYSHATQAANSYDSNAWWSRQQRGQADDDPALFQ